VQKHIFSIHWVRWDTERLFDGKLCQEYSYQKLSKFDNWFLSYGRKRQGGFFGYTVYVDLSICGHVHRWHNHCTWLDMMFSARATQSRAQKSIQLYIIVHCKRHRTKESTY